MSERQFLVARIGQMGSNPHVIIREVQQNGGYTMTQEGAWRHAKRLATCRGKRSSNPLPVHFTSLDGKTSTIDPERVTA